VLARPDTASTVRYLAKPTLLDLWRGADEGRDRQDLGAGVRGSRPWERPNGRDADAVLPRRPPPADRGAQAPAWSEKAAWAQRCAASRANAARTNKTHGDATGPGYPVNHVKRWYDQESPP